ncbi:MAG TPA: UDP-N-acetylglucosamine 2-epimerase (non-hydrolyzing) [Chitinophagaceae bacterium]|nr:UDP-N-acetylglucosamine 2-epimerase (non-hydrolyzing) [Chitinophagaceae bacterium]
MKTLLFIFGTRPEAIKMAPLIHACKKHPEHFNVKICTTGQHREMLQQVMDFFELHADTDLQLMQPNQTLFDITANALKSLEKVLNEINPHLVLVQGDTTTAFAASLAAFYKQIKVAHIEAGLRSGNKYAPFPEEINRKMTGIVADFHFAPTQAAKENLLKENITENIFITGNTVIDALLWAVKKVESSKETGNNFSFLDPHKKLILVTGHRRENFGKPFENICDALLDIADHHAVQVVYPVHLNPNVQHIVQQKLNNHPNIFLLAPLGYPQLVWLLNKSYFVITDSGGIQEEAPALGKPVLVMRDVTERMEGVDAGSALLVGTSKEKITAAANALLTDNKVYERMSKAVNPYGDGTAAEKIVETLISNFLKLKI